MTIPRCHLANNFVASIFTSFSSLPFPSSFLSYSFFSLHSLTLRSSSHSPTFPTTLPRTLQSQIDRKIDLSPHLIFRIHHISSSCLLFHRCSSFLILPRPSLHPFLSRPRFPSLGIELCGPCMSQLSPSLTPRPVVHWSPPISTTSQNLDHPISFPPHK